MIFQNWKYFGIQNAGGSIGPMEENWDAPLYSHSRSRSLAQLKCGWNTHESVQIRESWLRLTAFGTDSRYETFTTLGSATLQYSTPSRCGHTSTETMGPFTLDITWLIGSLHDYLLRADGRFYSSNAIWSS